MRIYLAGPIRGIPDYRERFAGGAARLRAPGHEVFSPPEYDEQHGLDATTPEGLREVFAADLAWISLHADAVVVLPGWEKSDGAKIEVGLARTLSLPVWELATFLLSVGVS